MAIHIDKEGREGKCSLWEEATLPAPWESVCEAGTEAPGRAWALGQGLWPRKLLRVTLSQTQESLRRTVHCRAASSNQLPWDPLKSPAGGSEEVTIQLPCAVHCSKHFYMGDSIAPLTLRGRWCRHLHLTDEEA